jgi:hypothetical protein
LFGAARHPDGCIGHPVAEPGGEHWDDPHPYGGRLRIRCVLVDLEKSSDANLVVAVGRWHQQALAEV